MPKIIEPAPVAERSIPIDSTPLAEPMTLAGREFHTHLAKRDKGHVVLCLHPLNNYTLLTLLMKNYSTSLEFLFELTRLAAVQVFFTLPFLASKLAGFACR